MGKGSGFETHEGSELSMSHIYVPNTSLDPEEVRKNPYTEHSLAPLMSSARTGDSSKDEWQTPTWLFELLHKEFRFVLDAAATEENALCEWFFDKETNGLESEWFGNVWVNPPFSQLKKWVEKGFEQAHSNPKVQSVVMLVPARTDTAAWWNYVRFGEVRFLPGRLRFVGATNSAPFPSAVVMFDRDFPARTDYWDIREPKHAIQ